MLKIKLVAGIVFCLTVCSANAQEFITAEASKSALEEMAPAYASSSDRQLLTLGFSAKPRFDLEEITWPAQPGDAEVCLWKGDKYAAASLVIDDNCRPDHDFWLGQCRRHDIKVTFFVITKKVGERTSSGFSGTWDHWRQLLASGYVAIESHSVNHHSDDDKRSDEQVRYEYAASKKTLETELPGNTCVTLAAPYGRGKAEIAADYYIANRGTSGTVNPANRINYSCVATGSISQAYIDVLLTGKTRLEPKWLQNRPGDRRGWIAPLYHFVKGDPEGKVARDIANLASYKDRIWIDTFPAIAKYAQQRDSANLRRVNAFDNRIELSLSDRMYDKYFDAPLTLKVRLPYSWKSVKAKQNNADIPAVFVEHEGLPYALIDGVPDRGNIVIEEKP